VAVIIAEASGIEEAEVITEAFRRFGSGGRQPNTRRALRIAIGAALGLSDED
jgi:hypothetical protein